MSGYSGTPLWKKLGIRQGTELLTIGEPANYGTLLEPLPPDFNRASNLTETTDLIHLFTTRRADLAERLQRIRTEMRPDATLWVSWPKRSSRVDTDITEDGIRAEALPLGLVDVKVCAVDEVWSGLKLVLRKELR